MLLPILLSKTKLLPFYITGVGEKEDQRPIKRENGFNDYQIMYCYGGSGTYICGDIKYNISKGMAFIFRPGVPHEYYSNGSENWKTGWVSFQGNALSDLFDYFAFGDTEVLKFPPDSDILALGITTWGEFWNDRFDREIVSSQRLYSMLSRMADIKDSNFERPTELSNSDTYLKIKPVLSLMNERYSEDISLADMADVINISPNHLCRLFNQVFNTTPLKYFTHIRLNKAKYMLGLDENIKIKTVAEAVGFNNSSYFCSVFKKAEGITPEEFKRLNNF